MSTRLTPQAAIALQVRKVRQRLWLKNLLHGLLLGWSGAFLLATLYFFVRSLLWGPGPEWVRWIVLGSSAGLGMIFAVVWAIVRAPSPITSSLALDERFALKERVTTSFSLSAKDTETPAGQALLEDAHRKVAAVDVAERFPIGPRWKQPLMPLCSAVLAVLALFFSPQLDFLGKSKLNAQTKGKVDHKAVQKQMDELKKTLAQLDRKDALPSREMKDLEAQIKELQKKELDPKDEKQIRETIQEMQKLEDKMKEQLENQKDLAQKTKDLARTLKDMEKLGKKLNPDGPAKDFQEELKKGDLNKAVEELEKLRKKLEKNELGKEDQKKLTDQLQDLRDQLERLRDQKQKDLQKEFEERLQNLEDKNLKDELDKEFKERQKELADEKDLEELEKMLGDCQDCQDDALAEKLERLRIKLQKLNLNEDQLRELLENCENLEDIRLGLLEAMPGKDKEDDEERLRKKMKIGIDLPGNGNRPGGGMGKGRGSGKRPMGKEPENSDIVNRRQRGDVDPASQMRVIGFSKGGIFKQVPADEIEGAFRQADQQSAETLERQRIPSDAADIAKGYFKQLGGQK